jgi:hypothetical protein
MVPRSVSSERPSRWLPVSSVTWKRPRHAVRLHPAGGVNGVAPQVIDELGIEVGFLCDTDRVDLMTIGRNPAESPADRPTRRWWRCR